MRLDSILFAALIGLCAVVGALFIIEEQPHLETSDDGVVTITPQGHGVAHPQFKTMLSGGDGEARYVPIWWLAWAFALLQVTFFMALLALGVLKKGSLGPLLRPLLVGWLIFAGIFTGLIVAHARYVGTAEHALVFGFPAPTAWMIYGVWVFPAAFVVLYLVTFDRWGFTKADETRLAELAADFKARNPEI